MSSIKYMIKCFLGYSRCKANRIKPNYHVYIGKGVNVVGGQLIKIGQGVIISPDVDLWSTGGNISIGNGTVIGKRCRISIANSLIIGEAVLFSPNVYITDCDHEYRNIDVPIMKQGIIQKDNRVNIGDGAYIGINSVIVGNVAVGKGSVIGANSIVTKDVPDFCVAVGAPAKIIKTYNAATGNWVAVLN